MLATAALVLAIGWVGAAAGPQVGGLLIAFPLLASLLAGFTHAQQGAEAAIGMLAGMTSGLLGFAAFCAVVSAAVGPLGPVLAFSAALATALAAHAMRLALLSVRGAARLRTPRGSLR